ncbi:hypothetical protein [Candidatus Odyssella acanthamoebae]|uniref:DUF4197 domain-containing protein n=1 Tax=Candidatus Odyssella acanthamoebae TaxID=91604 RepID=A0A077ASD7_9PROT|nr:hypothetical protein [Candidatus Paracaedibacter acanthamoebae]AIK96112.1 hypothetical protein ID47_04190 [Candidatus Paracaedibacter acanthamoebae]
MKLTTIKFIIFLGLLSTINFPVLAAEDRGEKISLAEKVLGLGVNNLFMEHQLPQTMAELGAAEAAYNRAEEMLWDGQGVKALPYLIYAEHYMVPQSFEILRRVKSGVFKEIPEPVRAQLKQAFSQLEDKDKLYDMYKDCWNRNEEMLRNSTKSSFLGSLTKLILGDNPSFPHTKPMQSISSEAFSGKQSKTSPYSSAREGTAEDMVPLLPGDYARKMKEE